MNGSNLMTFRTTQQTKVSIDRIQQSDSNRNESHKDGSPIGFTEDRVAPEAQTPIQRTQHDDGEGNKVVAVAVDLLGLMMKPEEAETSFALLL